LGIPLILDEQLPFETDEVWPLSQGVMVAAWRNFRETIVSHAASQALWLNVERDG
jgi:hypothetical protein